MKVGLYMESLEQLKGQKLLLEQELEKITKKRYGSTPWAQGVQDQFKSHSYEYEEYTDVSLAYKLKAQIEQLDWQIETYAQRAQIQRQREEEYQNSLIEQYEYTSGGETHFTPNKAIAARYNAQQRFFGMNKLQKTLATITGQKRKFNKLWHKATSENEITQEQVSSELNRMFR